MILFSAVSVNLFAQTKTVSGKVVDSAVNALFGATIKVQGSNKTVKTNDKGEFILQNLSASNTVIAASYIGYEDKTVNIANNTSNLIITLKEKSNIRMRL